MTISLQNTSLPHVVIVGGGFAGIQTAKNLTNAHVEVTLIDRANHHVFQPLLYQVATADLSPADISAPIRTMLRHQRNCTVLMAEVVGVDTVHQQVILESHVPVQYDYLILATGARENYFGHDEWRRYAPGLKTLADGTSLRQTILAAMETAEITDDPILQSAYQTFVLVGGGPTGVEMASAIAELTHKSMTSEFRRIDPAQTRIILVEATARLLTAFPEKLANYVVKTLTKKGVEIQLNTPVTNIDANGVQSGDRFIAAKTVIWTAGVLASPAGKWLGSEVDRAGRVLVEPDLTVPGYSNVYVIGDTAGVKQEKGILPGVAPVAMQEGRYVAQSIITRLQQQPVSTPFVYNNKGNMAIVGRGSAIADLGWIRFTGWLGWVMWAFVHILFLISFRNRVAVMSQWAWSYLTNQRSARLITNVRTTVAEQRKDTVVV